MYRRIGCCSAAAARCGGGVFSPTRLLLKAASGGASAPSSSSPQAQRSNLNNLHEIRTAAAEADDVEGRCRALREQLLALEADCGGLQDRIDRFAEEKLRMQTAARDLLSSADDDDGSSGAADVYADRTARSAGMNSSGAKEDDTFMVDPRTVAKVHKSRAKGSIQQIAAVVGSAVKTPIGHTNTVTIVGTLVEAPVYGYLGGLRAELGKKAAKDGLSPAVRVEGGGRGAPTVLRTAAEGEPSTSPAPTRSADMQANTNISELTKQEGGSSGDGSPISTMQLTIRQLGTRPTGFPSPSRAFMNTFTVHCRAPYDRLDLKVGDRVVIVGGHYGVHAVFQLDTTQWQLNPVVDVGPSGYVGVL